MGRVYATTGISLVDSAGGTVTDSTGLVGTTSFPPSVVTKDDDQSITGDFVWTNVNDLTFDVVLTRTVPVLFIGMVTWQLGGKDANCALRLSYAGSAYPAGNGWLANLSGGVSDFSQSGEFAFAHILNLPNGTTTVTVQAARSTPDETLSILGLNGHSSFLYVNLGK